MVKLLLVISMNLAALYHVSDYNCTQVQSDGSILIRLKTSSEDNIKEINLIHGDPFLGINSDEGNWNWVKYTETMEFLGKGEFHSYYQTIVKPKYKRIRYFFEIISEEGTIFFGEKGITANQEVTEDNFFGFSYPYIHLSDGYIPPSWLKKTIWYQIFPDRFYNGDPSNDQENVVKWNSILPKSNTFFGGDLKGIIQKLDYLQELGIRGIYLNPIFKSPSTHKYDTDDYYQIDSHFGTKDDLINLVKEAHKRNIKVILDAVFNHTSPDFFAFKDVLINQDKSKYKDWFFIKKFPISLDDKEINYETFAFVRKMPKINVDNKEVANYLIDVAKYWIKEANIDGFRVDVANEQPHQFYRKLREEIKKVKGDAVLIAESWSNSSIWLYGDQFDSVMNYLFTNLIVDFIVKKGLDSQTFVRKYIDVLNTYPLTTSKNLFNLLDSHDTQRIMTLCNNDLDLVKLSYTLLFTFIGTPCLYYGGEIGLEGKDDPDCRRCMIWDESKWNQPLNKFIKELIKIRNKYSDVFVDGKLDIKEKDELIIIKREYDNKVITTYLSISNYLKINPNDEILIKDNKLLMVITYL